MTFEEATSKIEGLTFASRMGLANSFQSFLRNVSQDPSVREVLDEAVKSPDAARACVQKALALTRLKMDFRYLHRYDVALGTYLWILLWAAPEHARSVAEAVVNLPRIWWAEQVAKHILEQNATRGQTETVSNLLSISEARVDISNTNSEATSIVSESLPEYSRQISSSQAVSESEGEPMLPIKVGEKLAASFDTVQPKTTRQQETR